MWIIYEIRESKEDLVGFFKRLGLCNEGDVEISNVNIFLQEKHTDLILRYEIDSVPHQALFENKTYSTIHSNQLYIYKERFPGFNYYKYLKLARINYYEKKQAKDNGYDVLDSRDLYEALDSLTLESEVLTQYKEFLNNTFIKPLNEIEHKMLSENKFELFKDRQAQQYFMDILYQEIDGFNDSINFKSHSNVGGSAWTLLDISHKDDIYGSAPEYLFWRIDKKSDNYYLRLNQYAFIGKEYKNVKKQILRNLREVIEPLFTHYGLIVSPPSNRGIKESEICILYFKDNDMCRVANVLVDLTKDVIKQYQEVEHTII